MNYTKQKRNNKICDDSNGALLLLTIENKY